MVFKCDICNRDFNTEQGLQQHNQDKHGTSSHSMKHNKKEEKENRKKEEQTKIKRSKLSKKMLTYFGIAAAVLIVGYFIINIKPTTSTNNIYNLTGIPQGFVHWHADVDVVICGEDKKLPESVRGTLLGTHKLHTHSNSENIGSLPGSDGNGVLHNEGFILQGPAGHTLEAFMRNIIVRFSETQIMDRSNGMLCDNSNNTGSVKVFVNDNILESPLNYIPRDQDFIKIEFG